MKIKKITAMAFAVAVITMILWRNEYPKTSGIQGELSPENSEKTSIAVNEEEMTPPSKQGVETKKNLIEIISAIYSAPVHLHGRVEDESGRPISGALIKYSLNDKYFKDGTKGTTMSDRNGKFTVQGNGASVYVHVQKQGYYRIAERSYGSIGANQPTSPEMPAVFVLKAAGQPQILVGNAVERGHVPVDGTPKEIHLSRKKLVMEGAGHLRVEVWVTAVQPGQRRGFQWKCRLSVPGGGLAERSDPMSFMAPSEGYEPSVEYSMPANTSPDTEWRRSIERQFYLKLPDRTYARGRLYLTIDHDLALVSFDSFWNQNEKESRNLEAGANEFGKAR
jgi:hypothetical protein